MWDRVRFPSPSWPGEVPAIHVAAAELRIAESRPTSEQTCRDHACRTTWMAGTGPAMTDKKPICHRRGNGGREGEFARKNKGQVCGRRDLAGAEEPV